MSCVRRRQLLIWLSPMVLVCVILFVLDCLYPFNFPVEQQGFSRVVVDKNGHPLRAFADKQGVWRHYVSLDEVSPLYQDALLGYEDRWFRYHWGVNPFALARALWQNGRCDCVVSGGSTLTMQVARRFHPHSKTIGGKFKQMLRAVQLEWHLSKDEILTLYLNYAPFGGTIEGVQAASYAYLSKPVRELTHADAALLAVLPQAPSRMRPDRHPQRAQKARDKVLDRLEKQDDWPAEAVRKAKQEQVIAFAPHRPQLAPLFSREMLKQYPQQSVIKTTIDAGLQRYVQENLSQWIYSQPQHSSAAVLILDNAKHEVVAYVGSADFTSQQRFGHVDMVRAIRSPGSTLKPFIYAMAIEEGYIHSHSLMSDAPRNYADYRPENFNRVFQGPVSVTSALQQSLNVPAVQTLSHLGADVFYNRMTNAGIHFTLPKNGKPNVSMALGGVGVSLWDLVVAFSSFANQGQLIKPKQALSEVPSQGRYLMHPDAAWIVYKILIEQSEPEPLYSNNVRRDLPYIAWKTGTSYGYRDAWAIGVSGDYTLGVWLGRPDGTPQPGHFGALNAAPKLLQIADALHKHRKQPITQPDSVTRETICWPLGLNKSLTPPAFCHQSHEAWLFKGLSPTTWYENKTVQWHTNPVTVWLSKDRHHWVDRQCNNVPMYSKQVALWPNLLEPWVNARWKRRAQIPKVDTRCAQLPIIGINDLSIKGLSDEAVFKTARIGEQLPTVALSASGGIGAKDWFVNGYFVGNSQDDKAFPYTFTQTGEQQVLVIDEAGNVDKVMVRVVDGQ